MRKAIVRAGCITTNNNEPPDSIETPPQNHLKLPSLDTLPLDVSSLDYASG